MKVFKHDCKNGILKVKYYIIATQDNNDSVSGEDTLAFQDNDTQKQSFYSESNDEGSVCGSSRSMSSESKEVEQLIDTGRTPKILNLIIKLLFFCFLIILSVSIANLATSLEMSF